jgi:polynucleotide 5'-kinase involved in rRNA processing
MKVKKQETESTGLVKELALQEMKILSQGKNNDSFQDNLRKIYKNQDKIAQLIEGLDEIPQQSMKDYYVKLQTIIKEDEDEKQGNYESVSGEKKEIEIEKIFDKLTENESQLAPSKLLILGGAGVGKSTLMQYRHTSGVMVKYGVTNLIMFTA